MTDGLGEVGLVGGNGSHASRWDDAQRYGIFNSVGHDLFSGHWKLRGGELGCRWRWKALMEWLWRQAGTYLYRGKLAAGVKIYSLEVS